MTTLESSSSIFISYAWGEDWKKKEWVRQDIVEMLTNHHDVFWDRDSIAVGELPERAIGNALAKRPLLVLCLCDKDYLKAAQRIGSGLYDELQMLERIADEPDVRVFPLILEPDCAECLPAPLARRIYLDLQPMRSLGLSLGTTILGLAAGWSQAQLISDISARIHVSQLRKRALGFLSRYPITILGNGLNHEVTVMTAVDPPYLLKPPRWMWESSRWNYVLNEDEPTFCPSKGRWHWECIELSNEIRPLGTAVVATFFPQLTRENDQELLTTAGMLIASRFFRLVRLDEPFTFDAEDLVRCLMSEHLGFNVLEQLLDAVDASTAVICV
ncbi:toll/interleukin-1 receptor domain-containing protein [Pseudomonas soli]|uniref:toll/interleukin-1 receptor domain-containing protein n=1 Tax=Pseudomonas soli TaxID=1306993 RepID=UPI0028AC4BBE|nr:toll/interleukin-1 receptor domain-containing protein [Pseudomonas soli]